MNTYRQLLNIAQSKLREKNILDADVDAWYLLAHTFGISRHEFILNGDKEVSVEDSKRYMDLIELRASHIPLQYITGTQEFMGLEFEVSKDVLIPRQDTECLVEEVLKICDNKSVLDMCTGSGCIIISLAKLGRLKEAYGADISEKALALATRNVNKHKVDVKLIQSDLFQNIEGTYDIIVSNPPYIPSDEIRSLMPEVRDYEPMIALDGACDGLDYYRRIISSLKEFLNPDGWVFFEIGYNQGMDVKRLLEKEGFSDVFIKQDLSGLDRIVCGRRLYI